MSAKLFLTYQLKENIKENLLWLRDHNELCDIILILGNNKVAAHSCVLASHSPVLAAVLQARLFIQNDWSILKPLIISLDNDDICSETSGTGTEASILDFLISFLYGETITVEDCRVQELRDLSKLLGLSQHFTGSHSCKSENEKEDSGPILLKRKSKENTTPISQNSSKKKHSENSLDEVGDNTKVLDESKLCKRKSMKFHNIETVKFGKIKPVKSKVSECETINLQEKKMIKCALDEPSVSESSAVPVVDTINSLTDTELWFQNELYNNNIKSISKYANEVKLGSTHLDRLSPNKKCDQNRKRIPRSAFFCSVCKSSFQRAYDLIKHVKKENHFSHICQLCFVQLNEYEEQRNHFDQHDHPLPFFCLCCDLRFRTRAGLSMHSPKHSNTKPYTCKECGRGFKWRHAAQAHSITHRSHCHLLCDVCGFSSKYASTFQSHLKRHYGQSFPCPHPGCKFKSFRKTHLNDHLATHAKLRSHQCEVCGHSFSHAKNLKRHMRLHTPDTSFLKCTSYSNQNCNFKTTRPDKLRFHLSQKHNVKCSYKISMPSNPNSFIPVKENMSEDDPKETILSDIKDEKLEVSIFNTFDIDVDGFKENKGDYTEEDCTPKPLSHSESKSDATNVISIDINDLILDKQNPENPDDRSSERSSGTVCFSDSYETYIVPETTQDNSLIVSENIEYTNRSSGLVLLENFEVLEDISPEEETGSGPERNGTSDKIEDIMDGLPVILQANSANEFSDSRIDYELNRNNSVSRNVDRNIQLLKLPDGTIEFLSHIQDDSSTSLQQVNSSVINLYTEDEERRENEENFKEFSSASFNLNSLF